MRRARRAASAANGRTLAACVLAMSVTAASVVACGASTRDVVPETHDVRVAADPATAGSGSYAHVARRPLGFVALAHETGLGAEIGARATEHLADALDTCATQLAAKGRLVDGGIRIEASVTPTGAVVPTHVTVAPGDAVAANALLCVIAPLKMTTFAPASEDAGTRTLAIDASWGAQLGSPSPAAPAR